MRLRRRLQVLFSALFLILLVGTAVEVVGQRTRDDVEEVRLERLQPAQQLLDELYAALLAQESGQRGYLLTGDEAFLEPLEEQRTASADAVADLRRLLEDDPEGLAGVDRLRSRVTAWEQLGTDFEITIRQARGAEVTGALVGSGTSARLFEQLREEIEGLDARLRERAVAEEQRAQQVVRRIEVLRWAALLAGLAVLAGAGRLVTRWVTAPLEALGAAVRRAASGALREPVATEGPPDLVELATDVDAMRRRLLAEVDDATRARAALADRGMIVVTLRDDLAPTPVSLPRELKLAGRFRPAKGLVAGDWWDAVRLDDDRIALALVDVSGHGAEVATFALRTKALTIAAMGDRSPGEVLEWLAEHLGETGELFLTGVILEISASTGGVRYASAGHPPLLLGGLTGVAELPATGPLLGPLPGRWTTEHARLDRGGVLVAYSDGLVEAREPGGRLFGTARLRDVVADHQLSGVDAVADAAMGAVESFAADVGSDDVTLVVLGR